MSTDSKEIGSKIRVLRKKQKLTLKEFGSKIGVSESMASRYEAGEFKKNDLKRLSDIAAVFHVPVAYFTGSLETDISGFADPDRKKNFIPVFAGTENGKAVFDFEETIPGVKTENTFLYYMTDSSMEKRGIFKEDIVVCRRQSVLFNGDLGFFLYKGAALFRRYELCADNRTLYLHPESEDFPLLAIPEEHISDIQILGKACQFFPASL